MKVSKQKIAIIALAIFLVLAVGYIVSSQYQQRQLQRQMTVFQQGVQTGYEQAVVQIVQQAATCQQVPIRVQNQTINIIAVNCLATR